MDKQWTLGYPPKDGMMYLILINVDKSNENPTGDEDIFISMGFYNPALKEWCCVGWNWSKDQYYNYQGEVIGWMNLPPTPKVKQETVWTIVNKEEKE